jgi:transcription antitermination factor NusB
MNVRRRTQSRERALQFLYQADMNREQPESIPDAFFEETQDAPEIREFARELALGCLAERDNIDALIEEAAENWTMTRMAVVDRNILRMAVYELLHGNEVPAVVAINEAIDLAKKYSTEQSGSFVNGILDKIRSRTAKESKS